MNDSTRRKKNMKRNQREKKRQFVHSFGVFFCNGHKKIAEIKKKEIKNDSIKATRHDCKGSMICLPNLNVLLKTQFRGTLLPSGPSGWQEFFES
jgi:hypothetical protein